MRIEMDHVSTPVNEFFQKLAVRTEPIELTLDGAVVATVIKQKHIAGMRAKKAKVLPIKPDDEPNKTEARDTMLSLLDLAHKNAAASGYTEKQIRRIMNEAVAEARHRDA